MRCCLGCALLFLIGHFVEAKGEIPVNLIAGKQVDANAKLSVGDKLVAVYEKKNYLVEIKEVKPSNRLRILWVETKEETDDVLPSELYQIGNATQTRKSRTAALPEMYRSRDKNGDGQIGLYEWDRAKYAEFKKLDKNNDGFLTPQELASKVSSAVAAVATAVVAGSTADTKDKPAPVNLVEYNAKVNETLTFTVTGKTTGGVWGTGTYSTESDLAVAAVHAGVLKDGATGPVTVTILARVNEFTGSAKNGVTSVDRKEVGPAFTIKSP